MTAPLPKKRTTPNPYEGRWKWWYSAISDHLIRYPGATYTEIAKALGKANTTIGFIANSDMFREFHSKRLAEYHRLHDGVIRQKLTAVAEKGLDLILESMEVKGRQIPMEILSEVTSGTLDKLGYGAKNQSPSVVINNNPDQRQVTLSGVSAAGLEEARLALRKVEEQRAIAGREAEDLLAPSPLSGAPPVLDLVAEGAEPTLDSDDGGVALDGENSDASFHLGD